MKALQALGYSTTPKDLTDVLFRATDHAIHWDMKKSYVVHAVAWNPKAQTYVYALVSRVDGNLTFLGQNFLARPAYKFNDVYNMTDTNGKDFLQFKVVRIRTAPAKKGDGLRYAYLGTPSIIANGDVTLSHEH
jgi:hypothetical protein